MTTNHQSIFTVAFALALVLAAHLPAQSLPCPEFAEGALCNSYKPYCAPECENTPFCPTECWTTKFGPPGGNFAVGTPTTAPQFLYCEAPRPLSLAFCGDSGPSTGDPPLPCTPDTEGKIAHCTCQVFQAKSYFIGITSILNLGAYYEAVGACGIDGARCKNVANCGEDGTKPGCEKYPMAPVCDYVNRQSPNNPHRSLMPRADMISVFSFSEEGSGSTFSTCPAGPYAGCMAAPCSFTNGTSKDSGTIECQCPIYDSPDSYITTAEECPTGDPPSWVYVSATLIDP